MFIFLMGGAHMHAVIPPASFNKGFNWSDLQPTFADTVVQIFSQVAEYNWLCPYKAPSRTQSSGSGFFINDQGEIITNAHVINEAKIVTIKVPSLGKRQFEVDVIGLSVDRDLALLKLKPAGFDAIKAAIGKIPHLSLSNSDQAHRAEEVMALGYPLGQFSLKSTTGVISGWEHILGNHVIQMAAAINPGSSGGPVINKEGQVVGVSAAGFQQSQNVGYIIPSNDVIQFVDQLKKDASGQDKITVIDKPYLGVSFCNSTDNLTSYLGNPHPGGLVVVEVFKEGPLARAGVQREDMIYEINGHRLDLFGELLVPEMQEKERISVIDYVGRLNVGDDVKVLLYRNGKKIELTTKLTAPDLEAWPLRKACLPGINFDVNEYEIIGGLCIMPLTRNHLALLLPSSPLLGRFADMHQQMEHALIVTDVLQGSSAYRDRVVGPGVIIEKINGESVKTLEDLRNAIKKSVDTGYIKIETQEKFLMVFSLAEVLDEATKLARENMYKVSPFMKELRNMVAKSE